MANVPGLRNLCTPAYVYLVISLIAVIVMAFQNLGGNHMYCIGLYDCNVSSVAMIFVLKILYIVFWTWVLNVICRGGVPALSWFFVISPFVMMFIFIGMLMLQNR
jgi:hypothetical protein